MISLLLLAASLSAQVDASSVNVVEQIQFQNLGKDVRELQSGRPTITGLPTFLNGIKFSDGTTQTTAASAQSGWVEKETQSISNETTWTFSTTLTVGNFYKIAGGFRQTTAASNVYIVFNGVDTGTGYKTAGHRFNDGAAGVYFGSGGGQRGFCTSGLQIQPGEAAVFEFSFRTDPGDDTRVHWTCILSGNGPDGGANLTRYSAGGSFDGAAAITSVRIENIDGGTSSGKAVLLEMVP